MKDPELMQRHDGELDDLTPAPIDATDRAKADALVELGELVRGHMEMKVDAVPDKRFAAMWREIDKAIDREKEEASAAISIPKPHAKPAGLWRRLGRWLDHHRGHFVTGAVSAGAVAVLAMVLRGGASTPDAGGGGAGTHSQGGITPAVYRPTEIESLDTPGGTGTVFDLKDEDGSTTVIWVTPSDTVEGI